MDAIKFIKERDRMCKSYYDAEKGYCSDKCPARDIQCIELDGLSAKAEELVARVEEWSAAHPRKTRQSVFLEQWPEAKVDARGVLDIEPCLLLKRYSYKAEDGCDDVDGNCIICRREFWMQEAE